MEKKDLRRFMLHRLLLYGFIACSLVGIYTNNPWVVGVSSVVALALVALKVLKRNRTWFRGNEFVYCVVTSKMFIGDVWVICSVSCYPRGSIKKFA